MFRPSGSIVLPSLIKKASLALRMESRLEKIFSMGINIMSLAVWLGEDRKCSAAAAVAVAVVGLGFWAHGLTRIWIRMYILPKHAAVHFIIFIKSDILGSTYPEVAVKH